MKKTLSVIVLILILSACNSGVNSNPENNSDEQSTQEEASLALSYVTTIPTLSGSDSSFSMLLINDSNRTLSPVFTIGDSSQDKHGISINSTQCQNVAAHSNCRLDLNLTNQYQNGYFELSAAANIDGKTLKTQQLISYSNRDNENEKIFYSNLDASIVSGSGQKFSVAVPVRSKQIYLKDAQVGINDAGSDKNNLNSALHCANNNECTAMVSGQLTTTDNFDLSLNSNYFSGVNIPIGVTKGDIGNLLISGESNIQSPANGTVYTKFTIVNNGHKAVSNIALSYTSSNTETGTISNGTCADYIANNSLPAGNSCVFSVSINSSLPSNSVSNIKVTYNDGTNSRELSTKLGFIPTAHTNPAIAINAPNLGTMVDTMVGESRTATVTLSTLNNYPLNNIVISNSNQLRANIFAITRNTCSTIQNGSNCSFDISYTPTQAEAGNLIILVKAEYTDQQNHKISQVSNSLSFNYNSNELKTFLTNNTANNGFNLCDISADGKSFNCGITGDTIPNINSGSVKNSISTFKDTRGYLHAYVSRSTAAGIVTCDLSANGTFTACPTTGANAIQFYNQVASYNGRSFLFMSNNSAGNALMTKGSIRASDGVVGIDGANPWENTTAMAISDSGIEQIAVYGKFIYIAQLNGTSEEKLIRCQVDANGLWDNTNSTNSVGNCSRLSTGLYTSATGGFDNLRGLEIVSKGNTDYLYLARADGNYNSASIGAYKFGRCVLNKSTGGISNCTRVLNVTGQTPASESTTTATNLVGLRFIRNLHINNNDYLYYGDNDTPNNKTLRRIKINNDGTLGAPENVTITAKSGASIYSQISGIVPFWSNTSAMLSYNNVPTNNIHTPGKTESITLTFSDGSAPNTTITLTPPAGVSVTPSKFTLDSTTRSKIINVTTSANTSDTFTITGTSDSGVIVPSYTFSMLAAPTITDATPASGTGINPSYISTNLTLVKRDYNNNSLGSMVNITFSRAMDTSKFTTTNIKLQSSNNNVDFSDFSGGYNWTVNSNSSISLTLDSGVMLVSGNYYRIILNQNNISDSYGNVIGANTAYEVTRFRAALKIFVTNATYPGNFGGLSGADLRCNLSSEAGTPIDGSYYRALIGAAPHTHNNTSAFRNDKRAPLQPGWVMLGNNNYYQVNAQILIATSTSEGKLPNTLSSNTINPTGPNEAWTGFDQNWAVIDGALANYACNNWSDTWGSSRTGFSNANTIGTISSATNGYLTNSVSPACTGSKRLYCVQQP